MTHRTIEYWLLVVLFRLLLDWVYHDVIAVSYAYAGFQNHRTALTALLSWGLLFLFTLLAKRAAENREDRVSQEIVFILFLISVVPYTVMVSFGAVPSATVWLSALYWLLVLGLLAHAFPPVSRERRAVRWERCKLLGDRQLMAVAIASALVVLYISGRYTRFRINFRLSSVYEYRAEAASFQLPTLLKYAFSFSRYINAVLIAYFIRRKKPLWLALCLIAQLLSFGIDGSKSTLFLMLFTVLINLMPVLSFGDMNRWILRGMAAMTFFSALLYKLLGLITPISLFIRRMMLIPVQISGYYVDFFTHHVPDYFRQSFMRHFGLQSPYSGIAYMIGEVYENTTTSANNGLVSDAMTNLGIPGLFVFPILLFLILRLLDRCAQGLDRRIYIAVALFTAVTLINSFLFTTLLTHGLLVTMLLLTMMKRESAERLHDPIRANAASDASVAA